MNGHAKEFNLFYLMWSKNQMSSLMRMLSAYIPPPGVQKTLLTYFAWYGRQLDFQLYVI